MSWCWGYSSGSMKYKKMHTKKIEINRYIFVCKRMTATIRLKSRLLRVQAAEQILSSFYHSILKYAKITPKKIFAGRSRALKVKTTGAPDRHTWFLLYVRRVILKKVCVKIISGSSRSAEIAGHNDIIHPADHHNFC